MTTTIFDEIRAEGEARVGQNIVLVILCKKLKNKINKIEFLEDFCK
jgi:hypothetical protein